MFRLNRKFVVLAAMVAVFAGVHQASAKSVKSAIVGPLVPTSLMPAKTPVTKPVTCTVEKGKLEIVGRDRSGRPDYAIVFDVHLSALFGGQFEFDYSESSTKSGDKEYQLFNNQEARVGTHSTDFQILVPIDVPFNQYNPSQKVTLKISNLELNGKPLITSGPNQQVIVDDNPNTGP